MRRSMALLVTAILLVAACAQPETSSPPPTTASAAAATDAPSPSMPLTPSALPLPTDLPDGVKYVITVRLKPGIDWSDGSPLSAADVVGTYDLYWAQQDAAWASLVDVVQVDDLSFQFWLKDLSQFRLWQLIRWNVPGARSQFGAFFDRAHELRKNGSAVDGPDVTKLLDDLAAFKPDNVVTYGPFKVDPASVTEAQMELVKNPGGFNADRTDIERVVVYWGDSQQAVPLILANQLDYTTSTLTPADERAAVANPNLQIIRGPLGVGPALWFNQSRKPFDRPEFRQAMAVLLDRPKIATVSLGESARPIEHMAGFSDNLVDKWLTLETQAALDPYTHDESKAATLLTGIGWSRGADGRWHDEAGAAVTYELTVPSDFVDFLATGQEVAQELTTFGIPTKVRGIATADRPDTIKTANYDLLIDFGLISTPTHPHASMSYYMTEGFFGSNNPSAPDGEPKGMNWPQTQTAPDGTSVDVRDLLAASQTGLDTEAQKTPVQTLSAIFNKQLPVVPLYERYTNEPINTVDRVTGWRPLDDPIYLNNQGSDNYISQQLVGGDLHVAPGGDGSFTTNAPYAQPPNYSFNVFDGSSLTWTLTSPAYEAILPPLFWFSVADNRYIETGVGASYSVQEVP